MSYHEYQRVTPAPPDIEEPEPMASDSQAKDILIKGAAEIARIVAAMVTLFATLWLIGSPAAEKFVVNIVDEQKLAPITKVEDLEDTVKDLRKEQNDIGRSLAEQGKQIDNIEKLAAEQRSISNTILLELRKP